MRAVVALLLCACGESATQPTDAPTPDAMRDAPAIDAAIVDAAPLDAAAIDATAILVSKWPRDTETFVPITGGTVPIVEGVQGFRYFETQWRLPASVASNQPELDLHYDIAGVGSADQMSMIVLSPADGGTRDSDRYLVFFNQFQIDQLDGAMCHITAQLPLFAQVGSLDVMVTLRRSGCIDNGTNVVCPDGGVP